MASFGELILALESYWGLERIDVSIVYMIFTIMSHFIRILFLSFFVFVIYSEEKKLQIPGNYIFKSIWHRTSGRDGWSESDNDMVYGWCGVINAWELINMVILSGQEEFPPPVLLFKRHLMVICTTSININCQNLTSMEIHYGQRSIFYPILRNL